MAIKDFIKRFVYLNLRITLNGKRFKVPVVRGNGFQNIKLKGDWFLSLLEKIELPANSVFVDVGVNVGQTILKFRSRFGNKYVGFEPNPNCVLYTKSLIKANKFRNMLIYPVGLSDKDGIFEFYSGKNPENCCTDSTIVKELRPCRYCDADKSFVPVFRFDGLNIIKEGETVSFVKIDAEGAELEILQGMVGMIEKFNPVIICEVLDYDCEETAQLLQERANRLFALIMGMNYKIYRVEHSGNGLQFNEIFKFELNQWTSESEGTNDYLFLPVNGSPCRILI